MSDEMPLARLLGIVLQHYYATLNERLRPFGLSAGQAPVMLSLSVCQNVTQEALARHFRVDKGAIARAARRLEEGGFIRRETDPADRRAVRLFLTAEGERIVPEIARFGREWEATVADRLDADEQAMLRSLLSRMVGSCADGGRCHE
ncbi:MAG: MarR family transcriptional regulator [Methanospirillum sp.]